MQKFHSRLSMILALTLPLFPACGSANFTGKSGTKAKNSDQGIEQPVLTPTTPAGTTTTPGSKPETGATTTPGSKPETGTTTPGSTSGTSTTPGNTSGTPTNPGTGGTTPSTTPNQGSTDNPGTGTEPAPVCHDGKNKVIPCPVTPIDPSTNPSQS